MHCIKCLYFDTKVIDTRSSKAGIRIRRRRQCLECGHRFSTIEEAIREDLTVIKRNGVREDFNRIKLYNGIIKATQKRPISSEQVDDLISNIIKCIQQDFEQELHTKNIGQLVMNGLKSMDKIAYVRFASVYKDFTDITEFVQEINQLSTYEIPS